MTKKDYHLSVDLEPEQKSDVRQLASASGLSISDWLRAVIISAIQRKAKFEITFTEETEP